MSNQDALSTTLNYCNAMIPLLFVVWLQIFFQEMKPTVKEIRDLYYEAVENDKSAKKLAETLKEHSIENGVIIYAYKGMSKMLMARNSYNPYSKVSFFNEGKKILEEAIKNSPENPEIRLLRFSIQTNAPGFLNYNSNIQSDKKVIMDYLSKKNHKEEDVYKKAKAILLNSAACTENEKELIRN